ncbi:hypothetical protein CsatB_019238 [Cannabis sativa]
MSPGMRSYEACGLMRQMNPGEVLASDQNHPEISSKTMAAFEPILFGKGDYFLHDENVKMKLSQYCHVPDQKAHEAIFQVLNLQMLILKWLGVLRRVATDLCFTGKDITGRRMEFHPEFKSRPRKPSALFSGLIAASCGELESLVQFDQTNNNICN